MFDINIYSHSIFIHLDDLKAVFESSQFDFISFPTVEPCREIFPRGNVRALRCVKPFNIYCTFP